MSAKQMSERHRLIIKSYYEGVSLREIAKQFNTNAATIKTTIAYIRRRYDLKVRENPTDIILENDLNVIASLYLQGTKIPRIARIYAVPFSTMKRFLLKNNIIKHGFNDEYQLREITLDSVKREWKDLQEPTIVTVGGHPTFKLIPLDGEE